MPRGRKPKHPAQKEREGNAGKRRIKPALELAPAGGLACPPELPAAGRALWAEVVPRLAGVGVLDEADRGALEALCFQYALVVTSREVIRKEGHYALGSTGQLVPHPAIAIEREATNLFLRLAAEFGMTPSARARIGRDAAIAKGNAKADLEAILSGEDDPPA